MKNIKIFRIVNLQIKEIETLFNLTEIPIPEVYEKNRKSALKKKILVITMQKLQTYSIKETINQKNLWNNYTYFRTKQKLLKNILKN